MALPIITKIDGSITRLLDFPGCDKKTLNIRKTIWLATLFALFDVFGMFILFGIIAPQLFQTVLLQYGYFLILFLTYSLIITPKIRNFYNQYIFFHLTVLIIFTAYIVLRLGGIATSAGLIIASISFVFSAIPLQNSRIIFVLFCFYSLGVLLSGLLTPWLTIPEQLTPRINSIIFMVNTLSMSAFAFYLVHFFIKQQKEIEQLESNKLKEINDAKTKLFTGITHEFRTPLTVIKGMSDLIQQEPDEWLKDGTIKIKNNCDILLTLVNQMLDLAKIEMGVMPVHLVQTDINAYIGYITELFKSAAHHKNIKLKFQNPGQPLIMDVDPDKLLHILSNLISNALKFTQENGEIILSTSIEKNGTLFAIHVKDNGTGIPAVHLPHIFDRFYQADQEAHSVLGTGLGLALVKELTELLGGTISVGSEPGKGSSFVVQLPVTKNAEMKEHLNSGLFKEKDLHSLSSTKTNESIFQVEYKTENNLPLLLIVEDNNDVLLYLYAILKNEYRIEIAENGKAGLEKSLQLIPDIILSDVMMPEMDGITMLGKIKNDFRTSHIPVVMLTAKADIDSRLIGLERGADAYLAKPFNENELHIQLKNLIEQRKKLHERYASLSQFPETHDLAIKTEDAFMIKVRQILENNLSNEDFSIDHLCRELAVSHAQLYRKFKSISNHTIADYFKLLRLHKAKQLLLKPDLNISEIAYEVGFKNLSYFSREFAQQFGKSPTEMRGK